MGLITHICVVLIWLCALCRLTVHTHTSPSTDFLMVTPLLYSFMIVHVPVSKSGNVTGLYLPLSQSFLFHLLLFPLFPYLNPVLLLSFPSLNSLSSLPVPPVT